MLTSIDNGTLAIVKARHDLTNCKGRGHCQVSLEINLKKRREYDELEALILDVFSKLVC